jgi:hypothetical protein
MNIEKPYPVVKPTDTAIDYSQCYLPFFESKHDGWMYYHDKVVSLEEAYELRLMGFSEPTHMAWYVETKMFKLYPENHNTSNVKISLPTREQADCFLNGR